MKSFKEFLTEKKAKFLVRDLKAIADNIVQNDFELNKPISDIVQDNAPEYGNIMKPGDMTPEQMRKVEDLVHKKIRDKYNFEYDYMKGSYK